MKLVADHDTPFIGPCCLIVGAFEPLTIASMALLRNLVSQVRSNGMQLVVALFDPPPSVLLNDALTTWARFEPLRRKIALLKHVGLQVALIQFGKTDIEGSGVDFLELICTTYDLRGLILGHSQSLGRGPEGLKSVVEYCTQRRMSLQKLPPSTSGVATTQFYPLLQEGRLSDAAALVGRFPVWSSGEQLDNWCPGSYQGLTDNISISRRNRFVAVVERIDGSYLTFWSKEIHGDVTLLRGPSNLTTL